MIRRLVFALVFLLTSAAAQADTLQDQKYLALVDAAIKSPTTAQWCDIRNLYPDTSFYRAFGGLAIDEKTEEAGKAVIMQKTPEAAAALKKFLRENFGSLGAHRYAAYIFRWNADLADEGMAPLLPDFGRGIDYIDPKVEKAASDGLLACIVKTGDGRTAATAHQIISEEEEKILIEQYYHVDAAKLTIDTKDGHIYHIIEVQIPDAKVTANVYFRLDDRIGKATLGGGNSENDKLYLDLVAKAQKDPSSIDWSDMRHIYIDTSFYRPGSDVLLWPMLLTAGQTAMDKPTDENISAYKTLLTQHYGFFISHLNALGFCRMGARFIDCDNEKAALKSEIESIAKSGNGQSTASAFQVIDVAEAQALAHEYYGLEVGERHMVREKNHLFEIMDVKNPKDGTSGKYFFDLGLPRD